MNVDTEFRRIIAGGKTDNGWTQQAAKLAAIVKAYDMVKDDADARIPTLLMAVIEMARRG